MKVSEEREREAEEAGLISISPPRLTDDVREVKLISVTLKEPPLVTAKSGESRVMDDSELLGQIDMCCKVRDPRFEQMRGQSSWLILSKEKTRLKKETL